MTQNSEPLFEFENIWIAKNGQTFWLAIQLVMKFVLCHAGITNAREAMKKLPEEEKQKIAQQVEVFRVEKRAFDREVRPLVFFKGTDQRES
jgi:hypothetical protein